MELHNYQQVHGSIRGITFVINSRYNKDSDFKTISLKSCKRSHFHGFDIFHDDSGFYMSFDTTLNNIVFKWLKDGSVDIRNKTPHKSKDWFVNINISENFGSFNGKKSVIKKDDKNYKFSIGVV